MGSCKECYHYEVCRMHYQQKCELTYETEKEVRRAMLEAEKGSPICDHFKDRSRFVELPNDFPKGRLTTDKPLGNFDALMNYAFAKDGKVLLQYANCQENMDLCDYIAFHAKDCNLSAQEVLNGACLECDDFYCSLGRAYIASVQAAELRGRLKMYEDLAERALKERENNAN